MGVLTDKPLWPWPMNQRILDAMKQAGYEEPVNVTKTIFERAGGRVPDFARRSAAGRPASSPRATWTRSWR